MSTVSVAAVVAQPIVHSGSTLVNITKTKLAWYKRTWAKTVSVIKHYIWWTTGAGIVIAGCAFAVGETTAPVVPTEINVGP
jgi:hypothetical protein